MPLTGGPGGGPGDGPGDGPGPGGGPGGGPGDGPGDGPGGGVDLDLVVGGGPAEDIAAALVLALVFQCIFMYVNVIFMV